jgi:hypothetical protein
MTRRRLYRTVIPSISTSKGVTKQISFKKLVNTYSDNDDLDVTELYAAIDARMVKIGRYKTRRGLDRFSVPVGETKDAGSVEAVTGASTASVDVTTTQAQKITLASSGRVTQAQVSIKYNAKPSGVVLVELWSDVSGSPGALLARSSLRTADITSTAAYMPVYFHAAPAVTAAQVVWVVVRAQTATSGTFLVSTTTAASTAKTSTNGGTSWSTTAYAVDARVYVTPAQPVLGVIRVNRANGVTTTYFAAGTVLYAVVEGTGVTSVIKTGLSGSATRYRFEVVQDALYWVNGYELPYKYDFTTTTVTQLTNCPMLPNLIMEHVGLLFVAREDDSKMYWSNYGIYDAWTSTDFAYMLAPKTPFTMTAFAKLNGVLYPFAKRNKYMLLGTYNGNFSGSEATSQRGTFSQESLVYDADSIIYANDDGVWMFNGTSDIELTASFHQDYVDIPNKASMVLERWNNRLYVFSAAGGAATNNSCYVINLTQQRFESLDLNTYIGRAYARKDSTDVFIQASNLVPALYTGEASGNDYHNMGDQLQFELDTAYTHFDKPGQYKRITKWRPEFVAIDGLYSVQCGYSKDFNPQVEQWYNFSPTGSSTRWDSGWKWDDGTKYAIKTNVQATSMLVAGSFRRLQRRYQHIAAREPVEFDSEVMTVEVQRLR